MSVLTTDLKLYGSVNMPEDDVSTVGGAIDTTCELEFTEMAANDTIEVVSDNPADTMNITVMGRDAGGAIVSETKTLNGTTPISLSVLGTIERVLKIVLASAAAGIVTVRRTTGPTTIKAIPAGIISVRRLFYDSASEAGATTRFEKSFGQNANGISTLSNAAIKLTADPSASIRAGVAPSVDDTATATNRKTAPAGVTFVDDNVSQSIPGGALAAGEAIGIWVEMQRAGGAAAIKSNFTLELSGTTT